MLTLQYHKKQMGPKFVLKIKGPVDFLSKDLVIIAYSSSEPLKNFSNIGYAGLSSFNYAVVGFIFSSSSRPGYTRLTASFSNQDIFQKQDFTVSLLRNTCHTNHGSNFQTVAHFHTRHEEDGVLNDIFDKEAFDQIVLRPKRKRAAAQEEDDDPLDFPPDVFHADFPLVVDPVDNPPAFIELPTKQY